MFPNCIMFDLFIEQKIFFEPYRCTYFLFDPTPTLYQCNCYLTQTYLQHTNKPSHWNWHFGKSRYSDQPSFDNTHYTCTGCSKIRVELFTHLDVQPHLLLGAQWPLTMHRWSCVFMHYFCFLGPVSLITTLQTWYIYENDAMVYT